MYTKTTCSKQFYRFKKQNPGPGKSRPPGQKKSSIPAPARKRSPVDPCTRVT